MQVIPLSCQPPVTDHSGWRYDRKGRFIRIAGDKIVRDIEGRESSMKSAERIAGVGDARRLIDRLAPGVIDGEVVTPARMTKNNLKGIVVRAAERGESKIVVSEIRPQRPACSIQRLGRRANWIVLFSECPGRRAACPAQESIRLDDETLSCRYSAGLPGLAE